MKRWIGLDIGGTEIKGALVDTDGNMTEPLAVTTPALEGRDRIMEAAVGLIRSLEQQAGESEICGIGIGTAGRVDRSTGSIVYATDNMPGWTGTEIKKEIEKQFPYPVSVENDVNAAAWGEAWLGSGEGVHSFMLVALGTGIGGAFFYEGSVLPGIRGGFAEIGHLIVDKDGVACTCGQYGCWETQCSGTALSRIAKSVNPEWSSRYLVQAYEEGNKEATDAMNEYLSDLARGLISVQQAYDPEVIILGGGVSDGYQKWSKALNEKLQELCVLPVRLAKAELGNRAGIIGAVKWAMTDQTT
ncbi:glucokinase [Paenibacillus uliginis N3/975]|uniref:Glucokinase n=1 Tax=Paenibacillus uliginis N3/975 TaxID=1313296 RepID=A0A1X7HQ41_9BACL|nr:ROK family protein [Paenibacillus uliginis]SMF90788.1 glucokinase [Paenibacillus uliginis N3/975]